MPHGELTANKWLYSVEKQERRGNLKVRDRQGHSDGGVYGYLYLPKSAQINFLWGKNDVRTAIRQFYNPPPQKKKTFILPQNKFLATPLHYASGWIVI